MGGWMWWMAAQAATWQVGPDKQFSTLGEALDIAEHGDRIELDPGRYVQYVELWEEGTLELVGIGGSAVTTIAGPGDYGTLVWVSGSRLELTGVTLAPDRVRGLLAQQGLGDRTEVVLQDVVFEPTVRDQSLLYGVDSALDASDADLWLREVSFLPGSVSDRSWGGHLSATDGALVATDLTLEGGNGSVGGGIYLYNVDATLTRTSIVGSVAEGYPYYDLYGYQDVAAGGAIAAWESQIELVDSEIRDNRSAWTGGALHVDDSTLTITNSTLTGNLSSFGGAVFCEDSLCVLSDSVLSGNQAEIQAGALAIWPGSTLELSRSEVYANEAFDGGAILAIQSNVLVTNNVFCGNRAGDVGGVLLVDRSPNTVSVNNHFVGNRAQGEGASIAAFASTVSTTNDLHLDNDATAGSALYREGSELGVQFALTWGNASDASFPLGATNLVETDPLLMGIVAGDCQSSQFAPPSTSPLIDAGDPSRIDPDQSRSDIGAFGGPNADATFWEDTDGDGWISGFDCDPQSAQVYPGASERCNASDDDCDDGIDEGLDCADRLPVLGDWPEAVGCACGQTRATGAGGSLLIVLVLAAVRGRGHRDG